MKDWWVNAAIYSDVYDQWINTKCQIRKNKRDLHNKHIIDNDATGFNWAQKQKRLETGGW